MLLFILSENCLLWPKKKYVRCIILRGKRLKKLLERVKKRAKVDTWCRNVGSFPCLHLLQCPKAPRYMAQMGLCVLVCVWVYVCAIRYLCHGRWWWKTLGMAPLRALPSTQQDKDTLILSPTHTHNHNFTHIDILRANAHTHQHMHKSTGCARQGSLSVVCQRETRALYSSHINNGPIWTGL